VSEPEEFEPTNLKKYLVFGVSDPSTAVVGTMALPVKDASVGWAVRSAVANVASVENSTRAVVESDSGLTSKRTNALVALIPSSAVKPTFGAEYAAQESVGET
jgi:hypothetical protein